MSDGAGVTSQAVTEQAQQAASRQSRAEQVTVTVTLPAPEVADLRRRAEQQGLSPARYLRRALVNERFFETKVAEGDQILVEDRRGRRQKVRLSDA